MKKVLLSILSSMIACYMFAYDCVVNGISYDIDSENGTATVVACDQQETNRAGSLTIPGYIMINGRKHRVATISERAFNEAEWLVEVTIEKGVDSIGNEAFADCQCLEKVVMPNSIKKVGRGCFTGCKGLASVVLSSNIRELNEFCFEACTSLKSIKIPKGVRSLGRHCFLGCSSLAEINIPASVSSIGEGCFMNCKSLPCDNGIIYAGACAVEVVDKSKSKYVLRDDTRFIGSYCFAACKQLHTIDIPRNVMHIGAGAFKNCAALEGISLPSRITRIEAMTFAGCESLRSCAIPENVTVIGEFAFAGCRKLSGIILPCDMRFIQDMAFAECPNIREIHCLSDFPPVLGETPFDDAICKGSTFYIKKKNVEHYIESNQWKTFIMKQM